MLRRITYFITLSCLFLFLLPFSSLNAPAAGPTLPQPMPPHPDLLKRIKRGEIKLPTHIANPDQTKGVGLDSPKGAATPRLGTIRALAVLVDFSDKAHTVTANFFDSLIFAAPVSGRGSVRDYYNEISYEQVDIVTVNLPSSLGWTRPSLPYSDYVNDAYCIDSPYPNNCQKLAEDVVDAIAAVVNFADYDNDGDNYTEPIMLIHAGAGAEFTGNNQDIWSHSWSLYEARSYNGKTISDYVIMPEYWQTVSATNSDMTIGVFAHEMGHGFWNLPDLYDRDYSSEGIGNWSLMAGGSWNGDLGSSPAWPDAWSRTQMGFVTPTTLSSNVNGQTIPQAYNNPAPASTVLKLPSAVLGSQEYFLIENRQRVTGSYEEALPGSGLLIWHIDEAMNNYSLQNDYECTVEPHWQCDDNQHYLVALEQADGLRQLEDGTNRGDAGDPFPGTADNRTWAMTTNPESSSWYSDQDSCLGAANISDDNATMTANLQVTCTTPDTEVPVDIKPQGCPNPLNTNSSGVLPVAILGTNNFDVNQIDPTSVRLEGVSSQKSNQEDVARPFEPFVGKKNATDCTSAGPDGFLDLTLKFDTQAVVQALGPVTDRQVRVLKLMGNLKPEFGGSPIVGEDVVVIIMPPQ